MNLENYSVKRMNLENYSVKRSAELPRRRLAVDHRETQGVFFSISASTAASIASVNCSPRPERTYRYHASADENPYCSIMVKLVVRTDRNPRPTLLHRSLQLNAERGGKQRIRWASWWGQSLGCAASKAFVKRWGMDALKALRLSSHATTFTSNENKD